MNERYFSKSYMVFLQQSGCLMHYITIPNLDRNRTKDSSFRHSFPQRTFSCPFQSRACSQIVLPHRLHHRVAFHISSTMLIKLQNITLHQFTQRSSDLLFANRNSPNPSSPPNPTLQAYISYTQSTPPPTSSTSPTIQLSQEV